MTLTPEQIVNAPAMMIASLSSEISEKVDAARWNSPRAASIDYDHKVSLGHASAAIAQQNPAGAVSILQAALVHFTAVAAEEGAARESERLAAIKCIDDQRLATIRESNRAAWAERTGKETVSAVNRLAERLQRGRERLGGISSESELREVLGDLGEALKSAGASFALESKTSIARESAEAARCAA